MAIGSATCAGDNLKRRWQRAGAPLRCVGRLRHRPPGASARHAFPASVVATCCFPRVLYLEPPCTCPLCRHLVSWAACTQPSAASCSACGRRTTVGAPAGRPVGQSAGRPRRSARRTLCLHVCHFLTAPSAAAWAPCGPAGTLWRGPAAEAATAATADLPRLNPTVRVPPAAWNGAASGCATGLALGWKQGPISALQVGPARPLADRHTGLAWRGDRRHGVHVCYVSPVNTRDLPCPCLLLACCAGSTSATRTP